MARWPISASPATGSPPWAGWRPRPPEVIDATGDLVSPALRRPAFSHGRNAVLRPAARERLGHAAGGHQPLGRIARHRHGGRNGRPAPSPIATGRSAWGFWRSAPMSTPRPTICAGSRRCWRSSARSPPTLTCNWSPSRRTGFTARRPGRAEPASCAGHGRRCRRRHPAFRTHDGGRRRQLCATLAASPPSAG